MLVKDDTPLRVIINGVAIQPITKAQALTMLGGTQRDAVDRAIYEISADTVYRGVSAYFCGCSVQVDVL